jgi:hypothetical protein
MILDLYYRRLVMMVNALYLPLVRVKARTEWRYSVRSCKVMEKYVQPLIWRFFLIILLIIS